VILIQKAGSYGFQQLLEYKETKGNCEVLTHYELNQRLGHWVIRQHYMKGKDSLRKGREAKLESIGFVWDIKMLIGISALKSSLNTNELMGTVASQLTMDSAKNWAVGLPPSDLWKAGILCTKTA
jgi:hypothetical protein